MKVRMYKDSIETYKKIIRYLLTFYYSYLERFFFPISSNDVFTIESFEEEKKSTFFFIYLDIDEKPDDHLSFADFLTVVHEYWIPIEDDKQQLQEAFDILDPENKSKLVVDEFVYLLKNCDWPDEEIDLILSQVSCADGYFLHDGNTDCVFFSFFLIILFLFFFYRITKNTPDTS
jgi:hypothetical protein